MGRYQSYVRIEGALVERVRALALDGMSERNIAVMLGCSRSAVGHCCRRLGVKRSRGFREARLTQTLNGRRWSFTSETPHCLGARTTGGEGVREPIGCRWIDGDPRLDADWRYCQKPVARLSWCAEHAAIVLVVPNNWRGPPVAGTPGTPGTGRTDG